MNGSFAAWLSSWSRQTPRKSRYMISTTGRMPAIAAPTPRPTIALSEIGVSRTRRRSARAGRASGRRRCPRPRRRCRRRTRARRRRAPLRARRGSRPWCGTPGASAAGAGGSAGRSGRARMTKSVSVATAGAGNCRAASTASSSSRATVDSSAAIASSVTPADTEPARVDEQRIARFPLLAPRRPTGSAAGRLRSDRASGRSPPRRRRARVRRASPSTTARIADGGRHDVVAVDRDVVDAVPGCARRSSGAACCVDAGENSA